MNINESFKNLLDISPEYSLHVGGNYRSALMNYLKKQYHIEIEFNTLIYYKNNYWNEFHAPLISSRRFLLCRYLNLDLEKVPLDVFKTFPKESVIYNRVHHLHETNQKAYYDLIFKHYNKAVIDFVSEINPNFQKVDPNIVLEALGYYLTDKATNFRCVKTVRSSMNQPEPAEFEIFLLKCINARNTQITDDVQKIIIETSNIYFNSLKKAA